MWKSSVDVSKGAHQAHEGALHRGINCKQHSQYGNKNILDDICGEDGVGCSQTGSTFDDHSISTTTKHCDPLSGLEKDIDDPEAEIQAKVNQVIRDAIANVIGDCVNYAIESSLETVITM